MHDMNYVTLDDIESTDFVKMTRPYLSTAVAMLPAGVCPLF